MTFLRRDRELPVVKGVSLEVQPSKVYGIVGDKPEYYVYLYKSF